MFLEKAKRVVRGESKRQKEEGLSVRWIIINKKGKTRRARAKELPKVGIEGGVSLRNGFLTIPKLDWKVRKRAKRSKET